MERLTTTFEKSGEMFTCLPDCKDGCVYGWGEEEAGCRCNKFTEILVRLAKIEDILGDNYNLDRLRELVEADRDGRCVVLPQKTVFELTWDAGPDCDMICPVEIDGEGQCDFCDKGELFVYERECKQEHIERIGKDVFLTSEAAERALKVEQDGRLDR